MENNNNNASISPFDANKKVALQLNPVIWSI